MADRHFTKNGQAISQLIELAERHGWEIIQDEAPLPEYAIASDMTDAGYTKIEITLSEIDDDTFIVDIQRTTTRSLTDTSDLTGSVIVELLNTALTLCPGESPAEQFTFLMMRLQQGLRGTSGTFPTLQ